MARFLMHFLQCLGLALSMSLPLAAQAQVVQPSAIKLQVTELNNSLQSPWGLAFLPDGRMLVTERKGTLKLLYANGQMLALIQGVPEVNSEGQGGLLDVVLDPAFAVNQRIYLTFSESDASNANRTGTAVLRASLNIADSKLKDGVLIYRQLPKVNSSGHFGSRLVFDRNGHLFVTLGDRQSRSERVHAQD
ncbi:MAG TPA: PQQ-dependent sugar dehydrogenase, partial [Burkholderiaceae bacterium]|nr:PQQ-dependent sugar dehydrogenase [Burkholderiaceae bacterium]